MLIKLYSTSASDTETAQYYSFVKQNWQKHQITCLRNFLFRQQVANEVGCCYSSDIDKR